MGTTYLSDSSRYDCEQSDFTDYFLHEALSNVLATFIKDPSKNNNHIEIALIVAARHGNIKKTDLLRQEPSATANYKSEAIMIATRYDNSAIVNVLIKDPGITTNSMNKALTTAIQCENKVLFELLKNTDIAAYTLFKRFEMNIDKYRKAFNRFITSDLKSKNLFLAVKNGWHMMADTLMKDPDITDSHKDQAQSIANRFEQYTIEDALKKDTAQN